METILGAKESFKNLVLITTFIALFIHFCQLYDMQTFTVWQVNALTNCKMKPNYYRSAKPPFSSKRYKLQTLLAIVILKMSIFSFLFWFKIACSVQTEQLIFCHRILLCIELLSVKLSSLFQMIEEGSQSRSIVNILFCMYILRYYYLLLLLHSIHIQHMMYNYNNFHNILNTSLHNWLRSAAAVVHACTEG